MQYIAAFFLTIFTKLFSFLADYFGRKAAIYVVMLSSIAAATGTFYLLIKGLVTTVAWAVPHPVFLMGMYAMWPPNADACIAACLAADVAGFIYRHQIAIIRAIASAN